MRMRAPLIFLIGALVGGGAVYVYTIPREIVFPHAITTPETVRVLVAKRALFSGAKITAEDLQWAEWPVAATPADVFTSTEALFGKDGGQRRFVLQPIDAGEPILAERISRPEPSLAEPEVLEAGMRAFSIRIEDPSGVSGFVAAGDHVDILLHGEEHGRLISMVILTGIEVLAVDGSPGSKPPPGRHAITATVAVNSDQASILIQALQIGRLSLFPRDPPEPPHGPRFDRYPDRFRSPAHLRGPVSDFPISRDLFPNFYAPKGEQVQ